MFNPPRNVEEFFDFVRNERQLYPSVSRVEAPHQESLPPPGPNDSESTDKTINRATSFNSCCRGDLVEAWMQVFLKARHDLERYKLRNIPRIKLINPNDMKKWFSFIFALNFDQCICNPKIAKLTPKAITLPRMLIVQSLQQSHIIALLQYFTYWLGIFYDDFSFVWIFSLLSSLAIPLQGETCHILRSLLDKIIDLHPNSNDEGEIGAHMIVSIIINYFRNRHDHYAF